MEPYKTQELRYEHPLFETGEARYFFVVTETYSPITGGLGLDLSLRRQEIEKGDVISAAPVLTVSQKARTTL